MKSLSPLLLVLLLAATNLFGYDYNGFSVDDSRISAANKYVVPEFINQQLDQINHLPIYPEVLDFFHTVPIVLINDGKGGQDGYYYDGRKNLKEVDPNIWDSIPLKSAVININKLTQITSNFSDTGLLYPLLWAFADQKLPGGYENNDLLKYAQEADTNNWYNYNWEDNYDQYGAAFFADSSIAFFLDQRKSNFFSVRSLIKEYQPAYYSYLKGLFGRKSDSYHRFFIPKRDWSFLP